MNKKLVEFATAMEKIVIGLVGFSLALFLVGVISFFIFPFDIVKEIMVGLLLLVGTLIFVFIVCLQVSLNYFKIKE